MLRTRPEVFAGVTSSPIQPQAACVDVSRRTAVGCLAAVLVCGIGLAAPPARAHDPNLARWDVTATGRTVLVAARISGSGVYSELRRREPHAGWDSMSRDAYRERVEAFLEQAVDLRVDGRRLNAKTEGLRLGHEVVATVRLRRRRATPLEGFTLDLTRVSSRKNQHHLVFVGLGETRERSMLHRSNESGLVLRWSAGESVER